MLASTIKKVVKMWKAVLLFGSFGLLGCASSVKVEKNLVEREAVCRRISRNLNLNRTESLGISRAPLTEKGYLMQEYQQNHCEDFEDN